MHSIDTDSRERLDGSSRYSSTIPHGLLSPLSKNKDSKMDILAREIFIQNEHGRERSSHSDHLTRRQPDLMLPERHEGVGPLNSWN